MEIPNDSYYQNMLRTLDELPADKKKKKKLAESEGKYYKSSPYYYLYSSKALSTLEAQVNAEKMVKKDHEQGLREEARAKFLSEKQAQAKRPQSNKALVQSILAMNVTSSSIRERALEDALLRPYRKDSRNITHLLSRCREIASERDKQIEEARAAIPKIDVVRIPLTLDERIASARLRREEVEEDYIRHQETIIQEKIQRKQARITVKSHNDRMKIWLSVTYALIGLQGLGKIVFATRELKAKDKQKWNACIKIQRLWRKKKGTSSKDRDRAVTNVSQKLRESLHDHDDRVLLFKKRVAASGMILRFLHDTRTKACMRKMYRVVKYLQRLTRSLRTIDQARILLLTRYFEKVMQPFAAHLSVVSNNRGLDLQNLSNYEANYLRTQSHTSKHLRLVQGMQSADFHALLRKYVSKLGDYQKDFMVTSKLWNERSDIRRKLFLKLLTKRRKAFIQTLETIAPMDYEMPKFHLDEIQSFMLGLGPDPLAPRLVELESKHSAWYYEKHRPKTPFRAPKHKEKEFVLPRFQVLTSLQPIDVIHFFIDFSSILREERRAVLAAKAAAANNNNTSNSNNISRISSYDKYDDNININNTTSNGGFERDYSSIMAATGNNYNAKFNPGGSNSSSVGGLSSSFSNYNHNGSNSSSSAGHGHKGTRTMSVLHHNNRHHSPPGATDASSTINRRVSNAYSSASGMTATINASTLRRPSTVHGHTSGSANTTNLAVPPPINRKKSISSQQTHRKLV